MINFGGIVTPFEDEVIVPAKEDKVINVFSVKYLDCSTLFCCAMFGNVLSSVSLDGLKGIVLYQYRDLANKFNLVFKVVPFVRG